MRPVRRSATLVLAGAALLLAGVALALPAARLFWRVRSSNPVRRGVALARELGCFSCHGELGAMGIPDPGLDDAVPAWGGGVWMMYVRDEDDVRQFILDGAGGRRAASAARSSSRAGAVVRMPAYREFVDEREVEDLTAAFLLLSGMKRPDAGTPAARGRRLAEERRCFACHGPAGSGGLPNPGSFAGFVPGWYGADFRDLVRDRAEFDEWVRSGSSRRLAGGVVARKFLERQRLSMPAYAELTDADLDGLWAYARWLEETAGGVRAATQEF